MAQPDINSILAALGTRPSHSPRFELQYARCRLTKNVAQQHASGTPQVPTPQQPPPGYPPGGMSVQSPGVPPPGVGFLPQPSSTGSMDLSSIKPVSSGSVSIADAIAKARNIAADRGVVSHDHRQSSCEFNALLHSVVLLEPLN